MIEIAIFPRSKMTITIKDGGRHHGKRFVSGSRPRFAQKHLMKFPKTIRERFPAAFLHIGMIEIAIFPRSKMTITIKDGDRHPPYQSKKHPMKFPKTTPERFPAAFSIFGGRAMWPTPLSVPNPDSLANAIGDARTNSVNIARTVAMGNDQWCRHRRRAAATRLRIGWIHP
jgi:hypothetical protein